MALPKKNINSAITRKSGFQGVKVTAVSDNKVTVRAKGRATTMTIPNPTGRTFNVGDSLTMIQVAGDSQKPEVFGYSGYVGADEATK